MIPTIVTKIATLERLLIEFILQYFILKIFSWHNKDLQLFVHSMFGLY